jgi:hypothetical protein
MLPGSGAHGAGWAPSSRDTKTTGHDSPFAQDMVQSQLGAQQARGELAGAQGEADSAQGASARKYDYILAQHGLQIAGIDRERAHSQMRQLETAQQNIDGLAKEASNTKINPNAFFDNMSAPQRIISAISMAVAGFGYGYSGRGANPAEMLNQRIMENIDAQKHNIEQKKYKVGEAQRGYAALKDRFGDDERASLAAEMAQRQWAIAHLHEKASDEAAPHMERLRAAQIASSLAEDNAKTKEKLYDKTVSTIEHSGAEKYSPAQGAGAGQVGVPVKLADGTTHVLTFEQAKAAGIHIDPLEARKMGADIAHTEAETKKLAGAGDGGEALVQLQETGKNLKTASYNPLREFQGTESHDAVENQKDYGAQFWAAYRAKHPGKLTEEQKKSIEEAYIPQPGDNQSTIDAKKKRGLKVVGGGAATSMGEEPEGQ